MVVELIVYLLILATLLASVVYFGDKYEKEPVFNIWLAIMLGVTAAFLTPIVRRIMPFPEIASPKNVTEILEVSFLSAGFTEEFIKILMVVLFIYKWEDLNEHYDGCLYFGMVGLGFSIYEDFWYLLQPLLEHFFTFINNISLARKFSLKFLFLNRIYPGHLLFDFIAGYFISKAKFDREKDPKNKWVNIGIGFFIAVFLHGLFDTIAFLKWNNLLILYVILLIIIAILIGQKSLSKSYYKKDILEKLPERKRRKLLRILQRTKDEKASFYDVILYFLLSMTYIFFLYYIDFAIKL